MNLFQIGTGNLLCKINLQQHLSCVLSQCTLSIWTYPEYKSQKVMLKYRGFFVWFFCFLTYVFTHDVIACRDKKQKKN